MSLRKARSIDVDEPLLSSPVRLRLFYAGRALAVRSRAFLDETNERTANEPVDGIEVRTIDDVLEFVRHGVTIFDGLFEIVLTLLVSISELDENGEQPAVHECRNELY